MDSPFVNPTPVRSAAPRLHGVLPGFDIEAAKAYARPRFEMFRNGYWMAHRLLGSKAKVYYGTVYDLPEALGQFDIVMVGMMLPHLKDQALALHQICAQSRDYVVV